MKGELNEQDMFYIEEVNTNHVYSPRKKDNMWFWVSLFAMAMLVIVIMGCEHYVELLVNSL